MSAQIIPFRKKPDPSPSLAEATAQYLVGLPVFGLAILALALIMVAESMVSDKRRT